VFRRLVVFGLVLSLLATMGIVFVRLTERAGLMPDLGELSIDVNIDMAAKGIELVHGQEGRLLWRLQAQSASYDQEENLVLAQVPDITYFTDAQGSALLVSAPQGEVRQESGEVRLWPQVAAQYEKASLTAREILYNGQGLLTASGEPILRQEGLTLTASVMSYDLNEQIFVAQGEVVVEAGTGKDFTEPTVRNAP